MPASAGRPGRAGSQDAATRDPSVRPVPRPFRAGAGGWPARARRARSPRWPSGSPARPAMRRARASTRKATWAKPCQVATQVNSLTHSLFGAGAWNCWFTRSLGHGAAGSWTVVFHRLPAHRAAPLHRTHQPLHGAARDRDALALELPPELARAVGAEVLGVHPRDLRAQLGIAPGAGRRPGGVALSGDMRVARRWGDRQQPADPVPRLDRGIGSTPWDARCASMNAIIASVGGRAPPGRSTRWPS